MELNYLDDTFAVSEQITPSAVATLKDQGFTAIVNNRPDNEAEGQPLSADIQKAAQDAGLDYIHIPMFGPKFTPEDIENLKAFTNKNEKVFAFCRTGNRSSILWNAAGEAVS